MEWYEDERGLAQLFLSWKGSMVLGANIVRNFISLFFLLCISVVSCSFGIADETDKAIILGNKLKLKTENGTCFLYYKCPSGKSKSALTPKPPCYFLRRNSDNPQCYSYDDVNIDAVLIVVGTPISEKTRKEWGLPNDLVCGEEAQGVFLSEEGLRISKKVLRGGVLCRDKGADEKDFWFFAHENDR